METQTMSVHDRLSKHILADGYPLVMDVEKSHGSYIVNENGDEYLDMFSMFGSGSIGYNHPHLVKNLEFLGKMAVNKPTMSDIYTKEYADFVRSEEHTSELQSRGHLVCRLLLEKK